MAANLSRLKIGESGAILSIEALLRRINISSDGESVRWVKDFQTITGIEKIKYQQTFRGIPVYGTNLVVAKLKDGFSGWCDGIVARNYVPDVKDIVTMFQANPATYFPSALDTCKSANLHVDSPIRNYQEDTYIYTGRNEEEVQPTVMTLVSYVVENDTYVSRPFCKIDVFTGGVIESWEGLDKADTSGRFTPYEYDAGPGGNFKIGKYSYNGVDMPKLLVQADATKTQCKYENDLVVTTNLREQTSGGSTFVANCADGATDQINGGYSPANDAHHYGRVVFDAYQDMLGQAPLKPPLQFRVHYGKGFENAFWDGQTMTFGDGMTKFYPLVSLDVVAHEVSHGFTEKNSNLEYQFQSGGINEAFSDMAGETVEFYSRGSNDFQVGFDIKKDPQGALRYMCNPPLDGKSIDNAAEYTPSLNVHHSSGVYNMAFCNLAKTDSWNTETAFLIFADANQNYWTPTTDFNNGACGVENAAADRGYKLGDVRAAFETVGVYC